MSWSGDVHMADWSHGTDTCTRVHEGTRGTREAHTTGTTDHERTHTSGGQDESVPGPISVQGDHGPVEIRQLTITPLER